MSEQSAVASTSGDQSGKTRRVWREWRGFVLFIIVMLLFRSAIADWNQVPTSSMIPSILIGDRIVVDKLAYDLRIPFTLERVARWADPERSDIITFEAPETGKLLVKRVIAIPGDEVQMIDNRLVINGEIADYAPITPADLPPAVTPALYNNEVLQETLLGTSRTVMLGRWRNPEIKASFGPIAVPDDHYWVMGDNRDNSKDSREIGFVHRDTILGKANSIAFSLDYENYYLPRGERFFSDLN